MSTSTSCAEPEPFRKILERSLKGRVDLIMKNREALFEAWIAQTGVPPTEAVLVERSFEDGNVEVSVERKTHIASNVYLVFGTGEDYYDSPEVIAVCATHFDADRWINGRETIVMKRKAYTDIHIKSWPLISVVDCKVVE